MTLIRKTVEIPAVPAKTKELVVGRSCVFCGKETSIKDSVYDTANWANCNYEIERVVIRVESEVTYPEGKILYIEEWDVCTECFDSKLRTRLPSDKSNKQNMWI